MSTLQFAAVVVSPRLTVCIFCSGADGRGILPCKRLHQGAEVSETQLFQVTSHFYFDIEAESRTRHTQNLPNSSHEGKGNRTLYLSLLESRLCEESSLPIVCVFLSGCWTMWCVTIAQSDGGVSWQPYWPQLYAVLIWWLVLRTTLSTVWSCWAEVRKRRNWKLRQNIRNS